jgi:hypothetical protein
MIVKRVSIISGKIMTEHIKKVGWAISRMEEKKAVFSLKTSWAKRKNTIKVVIVIIMAKECPTIWLSPNMLNTTALQNVKRRGCPHDKRGVRLEGRRPICPVSTILKAPGA